MTSPTELLTLLNGKYSHLSIGFNDEHAPNYTDAKDWEFYTEESCRFDWVSEAEKEKALSENSVWTIQFYPETPVGFYCVAASTFEAAAKYALEI